MIFDAESRQKHSDKRKGAMDLLGDFLESETTEIEEIWDAIRSQKEVCHTLIEKTDGLKEGVESLKDKFQETNEKVDGYSTEVAAARDTCEAMKAEVEAMKNDVTTDIEDMKATVAASAAGCASAVSMATDAKNGMESIRTEFFNTKAEILDSTERKIEELRDIIIEQKNTIESQAKVIEEVTNSNRELSKKLWRDNIIAIVLAAAAVGVTLCVLAYFVNMH